MLNFTNKISYDLSDLPKIRKKYENKIIIGQLNINSIRNKFTSIRSTIENTDVFLVSETKIDESFPTSQFIIPGFSEPFRLDRNRFGGGLFLYVKENIPSKLLRYEKQYEAFLVELIIKKQNWLIICSYNPHLQNINVHLQKLQTSIDLVQNKYEKVLLLGDFNCEMNKFDMPEFCENLGLRSLITSPTCYKNLENPTCIDLMLTNQPENFQDGYFRFS